MIMKKINNGINKQQERPATATFHFSLSTFRFSLPTTHYPLPTTHLILILLFLLSPFTSQAQLPWGYTSLEEACTDETYLIAPPGEIRALAPSLTYNALYRISGPYQSWGKNSYRLQNEQESFTLTEDVAQRLLPYMVSRRYWDRRYQQLLEWSYIDMNNLGNLLDVDTADRRNGDYSYITWLGYRFQPSEEWPVVFTVRTNTRGTQQLTLPALERLAEWGAFASDQTVYAREQDFRILREQQQQRLRLEEQTLDSLDLIGRRAATHADSISLILQLDSMAWAEEQMRAEVERTRQQMSRQQLFLFSIRPARSDYMFGLEFNFYNCFDKTITKIEIAVTPHDRRMRLQTDTFGRRERVVRCMGPVRPGTPAQYTFDELFWDDAGRIKYLRTNAITFYFTDGTSRTFAGYDRIMKHCLKK